MTGGIDSAECLGDAVVERGGCGAELDEDQIVGAVEGHPPQGMVDHRAQVTVDRDGRDRISHDGLNRRRPVEPKATT